MAGGGNTSYKDETRLLVKASGASLANIDESGFVCLEREKLKVISEKTYSQDALSREQEVKADLNAAVLFPKDKRPSVETSMHEIIQFPFVVHTHPTLANGLLCASNSKESVLSIFGNNCLYVPYTDPGYVLFKAVLDALIDFRYVHRHEPNIIFLENHGVFVAGNNTAEIKEIYRRIESEIEKRIEKIPENNPVVNHALQALTEITGQHFSLCLTYSASSLVQQFVGSQEDFSMVNAPFTPDNIVYCKSKYLFINGDGDINLEIENFWAQNGYLPKIIAVKDEGIMAMDENEKSANIALEVFIDMMMVSLVTLCFGGPRYMSEQQIAFIDNWEVENYRRQVSKKQFN
ncbi:MAG: class II aldolase [Bacteroidales bacterium]|nr:class II aldolase [Bacteroidales bacterium]